MSEDETTILEYYGVNSGEDRFAIETSDPRYSAYYWGCPEFLRIGMESEGVIEQSSAKLYKDELATISANYKNDIGTLNTGWSSAGLFDGTTEAAKKTQLQAAAVTRKTQNVADIAALKVKYGV